MKYLKNLLKGGDLRSIGKSNEVVAMIGSQDAFDQLFLGLMDPDRKVVMRVADALEKISIQNPGYLQKHKRELLDLCRSAKEIELKWHLALIVSRLDLTRKETGMIWDLLTKWATDKNESKIVRVNAVQSLFNLLQSNPGLHEDFGFTVSGIERENIPSLDARIRKIRKKSGKL